MPVFDDTLDKTQRRLAELQECLASHNGVGDHALRSLVEEALEELDTTLEELRISDERLREQHDALRKTHDQLTAERERYAELFEYAPDAYFVTDARGIIREANYTAAILLGVRPGYLIGKPLINYISMAERGSIRQRLLQINADQTRVQSAQQVSVTPHRAPSFEASLHFVGVRGEKSAEVREVRWLLRDVSESARAVAAFHQILVDAIEDFAIFLLDDDLQIVSWNRGAENLFGYATGEAVGHNIEMLGVAGQPARGMTKAERNASIRGGRYLTEEWLQRKDGSRFFASGMLTRLPGSAPRRRFVAVLRDATVRKNEEEALQRERDRLEDRVRERTSELARANTALKTEMVERAHAEEKRELLTKQWLHSLEQERQRISRELHDEMGQHLTALSLGVQALEEVGVTSSPDAAAIVHQLHEQIDSLSREMHRLALEMRPTTLDDLGLVIALRTQVESWSARTGIAAEFDVSGMDHLRLPPDVEIALYRATQEALNNIAKHAQATDVNVMLYQNGDAPIVLVIEDNGVGFDTGENKSETPTARDLTPPVPTGGLGLTGMRERIVFVGGALEIESAAGRGTTLLIRVPVAHSVTTSDGDSGEDNQLC